MKMSIRSLKIPGKQLGLGTYINTDIDAHKRVVTYGVHTWTAASVTHLFTQGQTRMATVECVLTSVCIGAALASASVDFKIGTIAGGTVRIRLIPNEGGAVVHTNTQDLILHYWIAGTPDPQRLIV